MNPSTPEPAISKLIAGRIDARDFPSAVYLVAQRGEIVFADAIGDAVREPERRPATLATIYDLASLTKPLVTGLLCARLVQAGSLDIDHPVARYLSEFDQPDKQPITVRQLLTHTSGLAAWRPLYLSAGSTKEVLDVIAQQPLEYTPGARVVYSDLGFITLGFLLQHLSGHLLADLAQQEIFNPLKLSRTFFNPAEASRTGIAACESGNAYERDMCELQPAAGSPVTNYAGWRSGVIWGQVHDGNAHFLGGAAGHAGLFANATDTLTIAEQFIGERSQLLNRETCRLFQQNMTEGLNEARSFAWQLAMTKDSTAGDSLPPQAFGHTGFTGTSCWIDAERERVFILLTNRTHDRPLPFANINAVRREFHTLAEKALNDAAR